MIAGLPGLHSQYFTVFDYIMNSKCNTVVLLGFIHCKHKREPQTKTRSLTTRPWQDDHDVTQGLKVREPRFPLHFQGTVML